MTPSRTNRLSRVAAKEVPHRTDQRFFAAKADVRSTCEDLEHDLRHSAAHPAAVRDFRSAMQEVEELLHRLGPADSGARSQVRDLAKEVQHLQLAHTWVSHGQRVLNRLAAHGPSTVRSAVEETQDVVMWCVRSGTWDGQLTAAVTALENAVKSAEVFAARLAAASA